MLALLPPLYLSWGIGANDTANAFGPQIGANIIAFRQGTALAAGFAFLGAILEGYKVFPTLGRVTVLNLEMCVIATLAAAFSVNAMTRFGLPISTSHAIVGALVGVGLCEGAHISGPVLGRVASAMVTAPLGAAVVAFVLMRVTALALAGLPAGSFIFQRTVRAAAIVIGCYAAYAMGANNVGNAMAPYVAIALITPLPAAVLGGAGLALGAITYSRNVVMLVGRRITALDPVSALVATLSAALTVHLFTQLAIPISTSQAVVGAVAGVGLTKGMMAVNSRTLVAIPIGWIASIAGAGIIAFLMLAAYRALQ